MKTAIKLMPAFMPPRASLILPAVGTVLLIGCLPQVALGAPGVINGTITGQTASGTFGDDVVTSTTIGISYYSACYFIDQGVAAQNFGGYNFVYAGQGVASGIAGINPSDFTVSQYNPWVGNNNATMNNVTGPDGGNYNRNVTGQEDGGANIVISYTPGASDPTSINFLQAYILNLNNGGNSNGKIDNGGTGGPFYNQKSISGTGTTLRTGTIPLVTSATVPGWLVDVPYTPEYGYSGQGDDTITSESDIFQTFISSQQVIGGTTYNVLYGGIQWGYSFTTTDVVPEPGTLAWSALGGLASLVTFRRRK